MTPREKSQEIVSAHDCANPRDRSWLLDAITAALQQASNEQLERDRARIAELEADLKSALERHIKLAESVPAEYWERMS